MDGLYRVVDDDDDEEEEEDIMSVRKEFGENSVTILVLPSRILNELDWYRTRASVMRDLGLKKIQVQSTIVPLMT